jgi:hypothetical protein
MVNGGCQWTSISPLLLPLSGAALMAHKTTDPSVWGNLRNPPEIQRVPLWVASSSRSGAMIRNDKNGFHWCWLMLVNMLINVDFQHDVD